MRTLLFILFILLVGCGSSSSTAKKNVIQLNIVEEPSSLDPRQARLLTDLNVINMMYEGLMRLNQEGNVSPAIAESYDVSEDGKTYIFYLRETKWPDDTPLTARDFEYSWKKILSPDFPTTFANALYVIKNAKKAKDGEGSLSEVGIEVIDDYTLKVSLENPTQYFLKLITLASYFPVKEGNKFSNGPFILKTWKSNDYIELTKNPYYWDKENVVLDGVKMCMVDVSTELNLFEKGELEWVGSPMSTLPTDALQTLKKSDDFHVVSALGTHFYRFNVEKLPFNNVNIRKAFTYAINRYAIVENVTQGGQIPAMGLIPPSVGLSEGEHFKDNDVTKAKELLDLGLQELGISKEDLPEISLMYITTDRNHKIAQSIQQQWKRVLGVDVVLNNTESKVFLERRGRVDYMIANSSWIGDFSDPINFLNVFRYKDNGLNSTNWENSEYQELLEMSDRGKDRFDYMREAENVLLEEMPIAPIFYYSFCYLKKPYVKNAFISANQMLELKWASLYEGE